MNEYKIITDPEPDPIKETSRFIFGCIIMGLLIWILCKIAGM